MQVLMRQRLTLPHEVINGSAEKLCNTTAYRRRSSVSSRPHCMFSKLPIGPKVDFWGSYLEFYKVIPERNYFGAYG